MVSLSVTQVVHLVPGLARLMLRIYTQAVEDIQVEKKGKGSRGSGKGAVKPHTMLAVTLRFFVNGEACAASTLSGPSGLPCCFNPLRTPCCFNPLRTPSNLLR